MPRSRSILLFASGVVGAVFVFSIRSSAQTQKAQTQKAPMAAWSNPQERILPDTPANRALVRAARALDLAG